MLYVEILNRAWISRCDVVDELAEIFRSGSEDTCLLGEVLPAKQKWCVDGPPPLQEDEAPSENSFFQRNFEALRRRTLTFR